MTSLSEGFSVHFDGDAIHLQVPGPLESADPVGSHHARKAGGADVNARDREGKTARAVAEEAGLTELAALLLYPGRD